MQDHCLWNNRNAHTREQVLSLPPHVSWNDWLWSHHSGMKIHQVFFCCSAISYLWWILFLFFRKIYASITYSLLIEHHIVNHIKPWKHSMKDCPQDRFIERPRDCDSQSGSKTDAGFYDIIAFHKFISLYVFVIIIRININVFSFLKMVQFRLFWIN